MEQIVSWCFMQEILTAAKCNLVLHLVIHLTATNVMELGFPKRGFQRRSK